MNLFPDLCDLLVEGYFPKKILNILHIFCSISKAPNQDIVNSKAAGVILKLTENEDVRVQISALKVLGDIINSDDVNTFV